MDEHPVNQAFQIDLPQEVAAGRYADFASIWHTENIFVLDFLTLTQPPMPTESSDAGQPQLLMPAQVVSRIRIPPQQVFELARALTQQLTIWEEATGRATPAGE